MEAFSGWNISFIVLIAEIVLIIFLLFGWFYGARRLDLKRHHRAIYSVLAIHLVTVFLWMIPSGFTGILNPFEGNLFLFTHAVLGIIPIILGIIIVISFLMTKGMPLKLIRRTKPLMIITIVLWSIAFLMGLLIYYEFYL